MKIPIGNTNNIGEQREAERERVSMKNNSIIVIGMEERKEVPCLHESAHGRSVDDRGRSLHRDRGGKLALLSSWCGSSSSESPISVERAFV